MGTTTENVTISSGSTLWGLAKQKLQEAQGEGARITNQQIVDAMKEIVKLNGRNDGDFDAYAAENFKIGNKIVVPGFHLEHGKVEIVEDAPEADPTPVTEEFAEDDTEETTEKTTARQNTTAGAPTTLTLKGSVKATELLAREINPVIAGKEQLKSGKAGVKKQFDKLKGKVVRTKAQNIRNTAAAKLKEARSAKADYEKEAKKLKSLRGQAKAAKGEAKRVLQKQIRKQMDVVGKARAKKVATAEAAKAAKRQVTKGIKKAAVKNITKTGAKSAAKTAAKTGTKVAAKTTAKTVAKSGGKILAKKIPFVGLVAGVVFAADRLAHGDVAGAVGEVASGAASMVPGLGTAVSIAIDTALAAKDLHDAKVI